MDLGRAHSEADTQRRPPAPVAADTPTDSDRELTDRVAARLHNLRNERHLTLEQLSRISGVSRAMLWQVEQGRSAPTIKVLSRLADALGVPVTAFLEPDGGKTTIVLRRAAAKHLSSDDGRCTSRALFPYIGVHDVEFYELRLEAGAQQCADPHPPGTRENLVVAEGCVEIEVGDECHTLAAGDALYFDADVHHAYRNHRDCAAVLYLVMIHPGRLNYG